MICAYVFHTVAKHTRMHNHTRMLIHNLLSSSFIACPYLSPTLPTWHVRPPGHGTLNKQLEAQKFWPGRPCDGRWAKDNSVVLSTLWSLVLLMLHEVYVQVTIPFCWLARPTPEHPGLHHMAKARTAAITVATPQRINPLWSITGPTMRRLAARTTHTHVSTHTHTHTHTHSCIKMHVYAHAHKSTHAHAHVYRHTLFQR